MNSQNKQAGVLLALSAIAVSMVVLFAKNFTTNLIKDRMDTIAREVRTEKALAKKAEEEKAKEVASTEVGEGEVQDKSVDKSGQTGTQQEDIKDILANDKKQKSVAEIVEGDDSDSDNLDDCVTKNGKLYYKGVCVPIPAGFKYLMKKDGFVAYTDSTYNKIFMVYADKHSMDVAKDGLDAFTYGFTSSGLVKNGPVNMKFGKNAYKRYDLDTGGVSMYAFVTASSNRIVYIQIYDAGGSIGWAKSSLTYLTYY